MREWNRAEREEERTDAGTASRAQRARAFLGRNAIHEEWSSQFLHPDLEPLYEAAFGRLGAALSVRPGDRILDAGCGECAHALRFARRGVRVVGVDVSAAALARARTRLAGDGLSGAVELQRANLLALPFRDQSFRFVSCWGVLMHVPDLERALAELARVLAPGGRLALMENNRRSLHHLVWDRGVRAAKWALGRRLHEWTRTPRGLEEWREHGAGGLLVRRTDIEWLCGFCRSLGLELRERFASQFTELYTNLPTRRLKRAVYAFNEVYFERIGDPRWALGNVLVFEKRSPSAHAEVR